MIHRLYQIRVRTALIALIFAAPVLLANPVAAQAQSQSPTKSCQSGFGLLTNVLCDASSTPSAPLASTQTKEDTLGAFTSIDEANESSVSATPTPDPRLGMREVEGVHKEYIYTDRVAKGPNHYYTRLREHPEQDSDRAAPIVNGDKVRVIRVDQTDEWYYVQIFRSHDDELIGEEGWIESWLIEDSDVPAKPTPTPTSAQPEPASGDDVDSAETAPESTQPEKESTPEGPAIAAGESAQLFSLINAYRTEHGLSAFQTTDRLCSMANTRAPEIAGEVATGSIHAGFSNRGWGYPDVENAVGMGSVQANFNWWIGSSLHRGSILSPELTYSCLACSGGNCVQIFSSRP